MTTFKEIRGTAVQSVSSDPSNPEVGQIWYNNSIGVLKGYQSLGGVWASGGNMGTARQNIAGAGTQTAGLGVGGYTTVQVGVTEEYDGSTWASGGSLLVTRYQSAAAGTQIAGLYFGGLTYPPTVLQSLTEEYDGSTWTVGGTIGNC
jgi:hypothetical protein